MIGVKDSCEGVWEVRKREGNEKGNEGQERMCSSCVHEQEVGGMRGMKKEIVKEQGKDERSEDLIAVTSLHELSID